MGAIMPTCSTEKLSKQVAARSADDLTMYTVDFCIKTPHTADEIYWLTCS